MRMLLMICGEILRAGIGNETIHEMTGVEKMEVFFREQRLRWFRRFEKMDDERASVKADNFVVNGSKRGRPKKRRKETIEKNMLARGLKRSSAHAEDRVARRLGFKTPIHSRLRGKQAGFQEDVAYCQHSWNKWMMIFSYRDPFWKFSNIMSAC